VELREYTICNYPIAGVSAAFAQAQYQKVWYSFSTKCDNVVNQTHCYGLGQFRRFELFSYKYSQCSPTHSNTDINMEVDHKQPTNGLTNQVN